MVSCVRKILFGRRTFADSARQCPYLCEICGLKSQATPQKRIILDLDATDDPIHGDQEGRFFHGYYKCYCYLPLYIFCGRELLLAKLRPANIDASAGAKEEIAWIVAPIRRSWPDIDIWLRADSVSAAKS